MKNMSIKFNNLEKLLGKLGKVVIAFSGGVDSTFLINFARQILGKENVLGVTIKSGFIASHEIYEVKSLVKKIGIKHQFINIDTFDKTILNNPPDRCYFCKKEIFTRIKKLALKNRFQFILDGSNFDDISDYRPGLKALKELDIISPLLECEITKGEIRQYSRKMNLPTWNKPAFACLASRIPYNEPITTCKLQMVEQGEQFLKKNGVTQYRVRLHDNLGRIEVHKNDFRLFYDEVFRNNLINYFKKIGFKYITLDLEGYRTGSLND